MGIVRRRSTGGPPGPPVPIPPTPAGTSVVTTVPVPNAATTLLAPNAARYGFSIQSPKGGGVTTDLLFVKLGAAVTTTDYSFVLEPGDLYEPDSNVIFTGEISAILNSAGPRDIQVSELSA